MNMHTVLFKKSTLFSLQYVSFCIIIIIIVSSSSSTIIIIIIIIMKIYKTGI